MKTVDFRMIVVMLLASLWLVACTGDEQPAIVPAEPAGEPVRLSFVMYGADATTRAAIPIPAGTLFRIYAYTAGNTNPESPEATGVYTVQADGTATGDMQLYRGKYDLYMVSYNSTTETPALTAGSKNVDVPNDKDFMHTRLTGLTVQPASTGASLMLVPLTTPFKRMGAQVQLQVKAKGSDYQPINPETLVVNYITVEGLPQTLSFPLGGTDWAPAVNYAGSGVSYSNFTGNSTTVTASRKSNTKVLLPVDGSALLKFTVNLTVGYLNGEKSETVTADYITSIQKVLLPGMKYVFDFTLTFYGILEPSDLTLAVRGYTGMPLPSDEIGK